MPDTLQAKTLREAIHIVWFKRDLRAADHPPLLGASRAGVVLPLYIIEPSLLTADDYDARHWAFTRDCLLELRERLSGLGAPLIVRRGEALTVLEGLRGQFTIAGLWAHEETGNGLTYARDRAVRRWCRAHAIPFHETPNGGVVRVLASRDQWAALWEGRLRTPPQPAPERLTGTGIDPGELPTAADLGLRMTYETTQPGGTFAGRDLLLSFLYERGGRYHREMSSPVSAETSCSRLSPHLAYGSLSLRQVVYAARRRARELRVMPADEYRALCAATGGDWRTALRAFQSRLYWRDHFIQKLEDEPEIEFHSFVRAYDALRDDAERDERAASRLLAWAEGRTGYPLIDACMRALWATGYINFRMRAMLVSFAAHNLWLKWAQFGHVLSRTFTDYEPGIHYSQLQMQSGTSGTRTLRIYNPVKQGIDQDPAGAFVRRWLPELANVPLAYLHEPWKLPKALQREVGCRVGVDYPAPLVDHVKTARAARAQISALRRREDVQAETRRALEKHGSRRRMSRGRRKQRPARDPDAPRQLDLGL